MLPQGPVQTVIVANYNASTYGFYAQEYYTLDYLDDVIQMQIVVTDYWEVLLFRKEIGLGFTRIGHQGTEQQTRHSRPQDME